MKADDVWWGGNGVGCCFASAGPRAALHKTQPANPRLHTIFSGFRACVSMKPPLRLSVQTSKSIKNLSLARKSAELYILAVSIDSLKHSFPLTTPGGS